MGKCTWCDEGRPFMKGQEGVQHMPLFGGGEHAGTMCHNSPIYSPKCPSCGSDPTYQTPDGTFWDSEAHYWRESKPVTVTEE